MTTGVGRFLTQVKNNDWITRVIDQHFRNGSTKERWIDPDPAIRPSGAGSVCPRDIQLGMLGHRPGIKGDSRRRMDNGTLLHERWERYLKETGVMVASEVPIKLSDPVVSGRLDAILQHPEEGHFTVVEIKSVNSRGFKTLPSSTPDRKVNFNLLTRWNQPYGLSYCKQLLWYLTYGRWNGKEFSEAAFLFENKDTQEFRIIYVEPTEEVLAEYQKIPVSAQQAYLSGELIERPFVRTSKTCQNCDRLKVCNGLEDGDEEIVAVINRQLEKAKRD